MDYMARSSVKRLNLHANQKIGIAGASSTGTLAFAPAAIIIVMISPFLRLLFLLLIAHFENFCFLYSAYGCLYNRAGEQYGGYRANSEFAAE